MDWEGEDIDGEAREDPDPYDLTPGIGPGKEWDTAGFATSIAGEWPPALVEPEQWMGRAGETGKQAFAPWSDRDHPDADPDRDARWKWGLAENHAPKDVVDEWVRKDPHVEGWAFIQTAADPPTGRLRDR